MNVAYMENHCRVDDSFDCWHVGNIFSDKLMNLFFARDITWLHNNLCTNGLYFLNQLANLACGVSTARYENDVSRSFTNHPSSHAPSKATCASNYDICSISTENISRNLGWDSSDLIIRSGHNDNLPHDFATLQSAESSLDIRDREYGDG